MFWCLGFIWDAQLSKTVSQLPAFGAAMSLCSGRWHGCRSMTARNCALLLLPSFLLIPSGSLSSPWTLRGDLEERGLHLDGTGRWNLAP